MDIRNDFPIGEQLEMIFRLGNNCQWMNVHFHP